MKYNILLVIVACVYSLDIDTEDEPDSTAAANEYYRGSTTTTAANANSPTGSSNANTTPDSFSLIQTSTDNFSNSPSAANSPSSSGALQDNFSSDTIDSATTTIVTNSNAPAETTAVSATTAHLQNQTKKSSQEDDDYVEEVEREKIHRTRQQKDEENVDGEGGSSFAGLLNGLFDTLTETATSNDCSGKCVHLLTAFMCDDITKSECPNGLKCCVEKEPDTQNTTTFYPQNKFPHRRPVPGQTSPNTFYRPQPAPNHFGSYPPQPFNGHNTFRPPPAYRPYGMYNNPGSPQGQSPSPITSNEESSSTEKTSDDPTNIPSMRPAELMRPQLTTTTSPAISSSTEATNHEEMEDDELETDDMPHSILVNNVPEVVTTPSPVKTCPGVCLAAKMTVYCDAVLNIKSMCNDSLRCCVPFDAFEPHMRPNELVIMNTSKNQFNKNQEDDEREDEMPFNRNNSPNPPSNKQKPQAESSQQTQSNKNKPHGVTPAKVEAASSHNEKTVERHKEVEEETVDSSNSGEESETPTGPPCKGECHSLIASLFCDKIDEEGWCAGGRQCCFNHPNHVQPEETSDEVPQKPPPSNNNVGHYNPPPPPPQPQPLPPPQMPPPMFCNPRHCFPNEVFGHCQRTLPYNCPYRGTFCCAHLIAPPPMPQPPPPRFTPPPSTTASTAEDYEEPESGQVFGSDEVKEEKLPCPGSCINALLRFTCFNQAEMTDVFNCPKAGTKCCAPKTAIKEHTEQNSTNVATTASPERVIVTSTVKPHLQKPQQSYVYPVPFSPNIHTQTPNAIPNPIPGPGTANSISVPNANYNNHHYIAQAPLSPPQPPSLAQFPPPALTYASPSTFVITTPSPIIPEETVVLPQSNPGNILQHHSSFSTISQRTPVSRYVCGVKGQPTTSKRRRKRVVGGKDSLPGEWCWQVALINSLNQYLCGGALIGTQWVLTAAHCVTNIVRSGDAIYVRVGDHDLTSKYGSPGAQTLRVATTYIHHNHNSQTLDNDIALLKLQGQAALKEGVCLVCLPARGVTKEIPGKRCTVTGYGYMGESGPIPLRVREAILPIVSESECLQKVNAVTEKMFILPVSSFCAGGELRNDACQGDGGGPLVCQDEGFYELTGLVSWGFGCGRQDVPGVYVKVSSFIGWINQIISVNNN